MHIFKNAKLGKEKREVSFRKNIHLEELLNSLNTTLGCAEEKMIAEDSILGPKYPLLFIMGPLRSGTTLFTQWLAHTGVVAYPTNLLSRFYGAPVIGAQIQKLLTDPLYNFRDELCEFDHSVSFESENGKTKGVLEPNEFWYFWRRFLPFHEIDWMNDDELFRVVDREKLVKELTSLTRVFQKPFALKSMILNYNISFLDRIFDNALFVQIKRNPVTNVASILDARRRQLGDERAWYSFKIPEYPELKDLDPVTQAAGQLYYINKAVTGGMSTVPDSRKLIVQYEQFCLDPRAVFKELLAILGLGGKNINYPGPEKFKVSRKGQVINQKVIEKALLKFL